MRVISKARLKSFWEQPGHADAEGPLRAWHTHVNHRTVAWRSWADLKASFVTASLVGDCVVFNIGGNKYRLIARVRYEVQKVFVLKVLTHRQYDDGRWRGACGCWEPPPDPSSRRPTTRRRA